MVLSTRKDALAARARVWARVTPPSRTSRGTRTTGSSVLCRPPVWRTSRWPPARDKSGWWAIAPLPRASARPLFVSMFALLDAAVAPARVSPSPPRARPPRGAPVRAAADAGMTRREAVTATAASLALLAAPAPRAPSTSAPLPFSPRHRRRLRRPRRRRQGQRYTVVRTTGIFPGCSIEAGDSTRAMTQGRGAEVVGVSMDPMEKHEEFCTAKGLGETSRMPWVRLRLLRRRSRSPSRESSTSGVSHRRQGHRRGHCRAQRKQ